MLKYGVLKNPSFIAIVWKRQVDISATIKLFGWQTKDVILVTRMRQSQAAQ